MSYKVFVRPRREWGSEGIRIQSQGIWSFSAALCRKIDAENLNYYCLMHDEDSKEVAVKLSAERKGKDYGKLTHYSRSSRYVCFTGKSFGKFLKIKQPQDVIDMKWDSKEKILSFKPEYIKE